MDLPPVPPTRIDDVVDTVHGIDVADPYRWLEDGDAPETREWVAAQNRRTRAVLDALPGRDGRRARLATLLSAGTSTGPQVAGDLVFSVDRWGEHDQAVLVVRSAIGQQPSPPRVLLDPAMSGEDTAAIDWFQPSPDGRLVAYGSSSGGDERSTLRVLDTATAGHLDDEIPHTRAASVAWLPDASAFAYTRYPDPDVVDDDDRGYWRQVWWHQLGDHPGHDELVWGDLPDKTAWPDVSLSRDGRWLLVHVALGWSRVDVHLVDRASGGRTTIIEGVDAVSGFEVVDDRLVGVSTVDAERGRVVAAPLSSPTPERWDTLVAETDAVIEGLVVTPSSLLVASTRAAVAQLDRYDHDGGDHQRIDLPGPGSLAGLAGSDDHELAVLSFTSFTHPPALHRWQPGTLERWSDLPVGFDPGAYDVRQIRYPSTDGTDVAMFLVSAKGAKPDPGTPAVLTGYGGFSVTMSPAFSPAAVAVCDDGGLYAMACIRGGAEEGEAWHRAGSRGHKQQSFDDFFAAADWLVAEGLTSRARLAIRGGSNGGLLMGAALTQRPDLCRAAQVAVPLADMVRYPRFLIARLWVPEYGDPDVADEFTWLWAYSPYHRVVDGTCYPAVLVTTGEEDSRVDPAHARKLAARLQAATACGDDHPVLLRVEHQAGHGQGKPATRQADELTDVLSFLLCAGRPPAPEQQPSETRR
ncbi:prolyl oligopeptidase family serine peptidase [soil metagenome]